jgi:fibronectin type 3 domain-containing protein
MSGGLPIRNYSVFRGTTAANLTQVATVGQPAYNDTSGSPATAYYYAVQATDTGGDVSPMSATVSATTPALPSAPANLASTPSSDSSIGLTWSPAVSGGLPIQNYRVYRGTTSANLSQVAVVQQTAYNDSTVSAGTTYYYAVAAADSAGDLSPMSATLPVAVPSAPSAPAGLVATPVSTVKISLSWSVPVSGGLPIRNYSVFRGTTPAKLTQVATVGQPAYNDASGSPATTYYYAVQATDTGGDVSAMSATVSATTLALPSAPTNLVATAPSKIQVGLTWTAAQSGMPLQSYNVFRGTSPSSLTSLKLVAATQDWANDGTVSPDTTYYYAVQANDTGGNTSPMSAVVSVTTP